MSDALGGEFGGDDDQTCRRAISRDFGSFMRELGEPRRRRLSSIGMLHLDDDDAPPRKLAKQAGAATSPQSAEVAQLKVSLAKARGEAASLQMRVNRMNAVAAESQAASERQRVTSNNQLKELREKVRLLESSRQQQSPTMSVSLRQEFDAQLAEAVASNDRLLGDKAELLTQLNEARDKSVAEKERLETALNEERSRTAELQLNVEREVAERHIADERNAALLGELQEVKAEVFRVDGLLRAERLELQRWQDDVQLHRGMREELADLTRLRAETTDLRRRCEHYRATSENTALLNERLLSLQQSLEAAQRRSADLLMENSELKATIAQQSRRSDCGSPSLTTVDSLAHKIVELRGENDRLRKCCTEVDGDRESLSTELAAKDSHITDLEARLDATQTEARRLSAELLDHERVREERDGLRDRLRQLEDVAQSDAKAVEAESRVLHMEWNPLAEAHEEHRQSVERLREENASLRARVAEFEEARRTAPSGGGDDDITGRAVLRVQDEQRLQQMDELRQQIERLEKEKKRTTEIQSQLALKYREMCTTLTGYQFKMRDAARYEVASIYESREREHFLFQTDDGGRVQLLETDYSSEWLDFVEMYLKTDNSIPAFLAAVTLQLYARETETSSALLLSDRTAAAAADSGLPAPDC